MFSLSTPGQSQWNVPQHAQLPDVVKVLKEAGCGLVRLPWNQSNNIGALRRQTDRFLSGGMKVVIDFHPDGRVDSRLALWQLEEIWAQLAATFAHVDPKDLACHILNEPNANLCHEFYYRELQKACEAVWDITPNRLCIFSNHLMGNPDGWKFPPPIGGPVAAAMSYYRPYDVVKKGSERAYPPSKEGLLKDFPYDDWVNQELHFKVFRDYCDKHKIQPWLSETGCHRDVPGRLQYAKDIKGLGEKYNIPICWWAFRDEYGANPRYYDPKRGIVLERDHYYWETITTT
jgi:hypothetical protein